MEGITANRIAELYTGRPWQEADESTLSRTALKKRRRLEESRTEQRKRKKLKKQARGAVKKLPVPHADELPPQEAAEGASVTEAAKGESAKGESVTEAAKGESVTEAAKGESVTEAAEGESVTDAAKGASVNEPFIPRRVKRRQEFEDRSSNAPHILVDMNFEALESNKELISLKQQVATSYSINFKAPTPFRLGFVGLGSYMLSNDGLAKCSGAGSWCCGITSVKLECLVNDDTRSRFIYLTADSPTTLDTIEDDNILIIGGLIDRNRYPKLTLTKANDIGIRTARLPIGEFLAVRGSKVLTVNQVVSILTSFREKGDWKEAFEHAIPSRKV
ncbi:MAG: hypothetical protein KVP17_000851 [Porospora cf. gigantea B]|uniref:uncharacterized protein n=1 Tax=Porospora cf. gigantea B TaxID=2853592 RepID=UPI003571C262|nr:MAG: hypothetical protein KVP17_000851 [Porospora cf. gigantea B]